LNLELLEIAGRIDAGVVKTSGRRRGSPFVLVFASAGDCLGDLYTLGVHFRLLCEEMQFAEIGLFS